ncbi:hypothetical protein BU592_08105 [Staphylococcus arlettae]|uniref:PH domain-containing protein n=1 Tax=Staphylococcus arlettae TaxID=29378 RepID=UPI000D1B4F7F|nr:PH domain-containing protein [Staphylococcus arlettae]PTH32871.1 hypothetical protein BU592_08105 [Staphylococcus arlettae]RIM57481.1 hypothetical protein BU603_09835 [Staphylococcus arlettae]RIM62466.1 hypothetical protein BU604_04680 [Staphylococcus arlettae]
MYKPQKLHPISYLSGVIEAIKQNIVLIFIFIIFNLDSFDFANPKSYIYPGIILTIFIITFIYHALVVYKTKYWIENDHFIMDYGIVTKKRKELNIRRIQTVDTSQGVIHQIVGGVKLQIKTPSDGVELDTVSKLQSEHIRNTIKQMQNEEQQEVTDSVENVTQEGQDYNSASTPHKVLFKLSKKQLLFMAMTSGAIGIALATIAPIIGSFSEVIPWERLSEKVANISQAIFVIVSLLVAIILIISYVIGTLIVFIRYYNYTLSAHNDQLTIRYGLFNVKNITVPTNRVQAILEKQSFVRKLFGVTSITFVTTSDTKVESDDTTMADGNVLILPFIKRNSAYRMLQELVPSFEFKPAAKIMPNRAFHRYFIKEAAILLIIGAALSYFWTIWVMVVICMIIILLIINAVITVKSSGLYYFDDQLVIRNVSLIGIKQFYLKKDKILGMELTSNTFMDKSKLRSFKCIVAKGIANTKIGLRFVEKQQALDLKAWYLRGDGHE